MMITAAEGTAESETIIISQIRSITTIVVLVIIRLTTIMVEIPNDDYLR